MFASIKKTVLYSLCLLAFVTVTSTTASTVVLAADQIGNCLYQGTDLSTDLNSTGDCVAPTPATKSKSLNLTDVIKLVVNTLSIVVGVIAVIMIIWGGMKYITSGGESNKITSAKNTIIYALIGMIIVALSQFMVRFVLTKTGDVTRQCPPGRHVSGGACVKN